MQTVSWDCPAQTKRFQTILQAQTSLCEMVFFTSTDRKCTTFAACRCCQLAHQQVIIFLRLFVLPFCFEFRLNSSLERANLGKSGSGPVWSPLELRVRLSSPPAARRRRVFGSSSPVSSNWQLSRGPKNVHFPCPNFGRRGPSSLFRVAKSGRGSKTSAMQSENPFVQLQTAGSNLLHVHADSYTSATMEVLCTTGLFGLLNEPAQLSKIETPSRRLQQKAALLPQLLSIAMTGSFRLVVARRPVQMSKVQVCDQSGM